MEDFLKFLTEHAVWAKFVLFLNLMYQADTILNFDFACIFKYYNDKICRLFKKLQDLYRIVLSVPNRRIMAKKNINRVDAFHIEQQVPYIGKILAEQIIDYRDSLFDRKFRNIEQLLEIPGIDKARFWVVAQVYKVHP